MMFSADAKLLKPADKLCPAMYDEPADTAITEAIVPTIMPTFSPNRAVAPA
ncbi:hypothetical protein D3C81_2200940 [compost metagenome]